MRYRVVITETNIDEETHPQAFRYTLDANSEAEAAQNAQARFAEQHARPPAPRAIISVQPLDSWISNPNPRRPGHRGSAEPDDPLGIRQRPHRVHADEGVPLLCPPG